MGKGKILALDYGHTIGLAVCDEGQQMAFGRGSLDRSKGFNFVSRRIHELCDQEHVVKIVIGLPYSEEGGETPQTRRFRRFASELESVVAPIPIVFQDESFTTFEANFFQSEMGVSPFDLKKNEDELAAIFILRRYLETLG